MPSDTDPREAMADLARRADRIVNLILHSDLPRVDIEIEIETFREACLRQYPTARPSSRCSTRAGSGASGSSGAASGRGSRKARGLTSRARE